jgi:iron(III) transport system substrate-binding protein
MKRGALVLCLSLLASLLGGCGSPSQGLVIYSGQHPQLTNALVSAFEKQTGINVSVRSDDSIVLAQELIQQGGAPQADVYLAENSPELGLLQEKGLLAKVDTATLDQMPAQYSSASGSWVAVAARVSCLVYNNRLIQPGELPASILDLASPQWKGKVAIAPSDSDFVPWVAAVTAAKGEAATRNWLQGLKNNATIYTDFEAVTAAVDRGDVAVGVINQYYWYRLRLEVGAGNMHSSLQYFPGFGTFENVAGAAVVRSAAHAANAQKFVAFVTGDQGQKILADGDDFEYPLRPGVAPNPVLPPLGSIRPAFLNPAALGDDQAAAALLRSVGLV